MTYLALILGLVFLVFAADRFVLGAGATALHFNMSPLFVGMIIVGFGTSAPEIFVSAMSALDGSAGIALGNAYGSNITNLGLILGITALIAPIAVHSSLVRFELPLLTLTLPLTAAHLWDSAFSRVEGVVLLTFFAGILGWGYYRDKESPPDELGAEAGEAIERKKKLSLAAALVWTAVGLIGLMVSSRMLVWGAVEIARDWGVSDLLIGLTVVSIGTSLPELASSVIAARKGEHDLALGNIIGSNLFNTLIVVGIAAVIAPFDMDPIALQRDVPVMAALTIGVFVFAFGFRGPARLNRIEGGLLLVVYLAYTTYLIVEAVA